jgi:transposase-like protein
MGTFTMFKIIVKVPCRRQRVRMTEWRSTSPVHPEGADTAHAEFVICDQSIEQDHRGVKRITRPMLGFKAFDAAQATLVGIELMHMIKKRQLVVEEGDEGRTAAEQFYVLAA